MPDIFELPKRIPKKRANQYLNPDRIINGLRDALDKKGAMPIRNFELPIVLNEENKIVVNLFLPTCPPITVYFKFAGDPPPVPFEISSKHLGQFSNYWIISNSAVTSPHPGENHFIFTGDSEEQIDSCAIMIIETQKTSRVKLIEGIDDKLEFKKYISMDNARKFSKEQRSYQIEEFNNSITLEEKMIAELEIKIGNIKSLESTRKSDEQKELNKEYENRNNKLKSLRYDRDQLNAIEDDPETINYNKESRYLFKKLSEMDSSWKNAASMILLIAGSFMAEDGASLLESYSKLQELSKNTHYDMTILMMGRIVEKILYILFKNFNIKIPTDAGKMKNKPSELEKEMSNCDSYEKNQSDCPLWLKKQYPENSNENSNCYHSAKKRFKVLITRSQFNLTCDRHIFNDTVRNLLYSIMDKRNSVAHASDGRDDVFSNSIDVDVCLEFSRLLFGLSYMIQEYGFRMNLAKHNFE